MTSPFLIPEDLFDAGTAVHEPELFVATAEDDSIGVGFVLTERVIFRMLIDGGPTCRALNFVRMKRPLVEGGNRMWACLRDFYFALGFSDNEGLDAYLRRSSPLLRENCNRFDIDYDESLVPSRKAVLTGATDDGLLCEDLAARHYEETVCSPAFLILFLCINVGSRKKQVRSVALMLLAWLVGITGQAPSLQLGGEHFDMCVGLVARNTCRHRQKFEDRMVDKNGEEWTSNASHDFIAQYTCLPQCKNIEGQFKTVLM